MEANAILDGTVVLGGHGHGTRQGAVPGGAVGGPPVLRMEPLLRPSSTSSSSASTTGARASTSALQLPPPPSLLRVSHGIDQRRHKGEDRTAQLQSGAISLYLVADGHGGSGAARLAAERLLRDIGTAMAAGAAGAAEAGGMRLVRDASGQWVEEVADEDGGPMYPLDKKNRRRASSQTTMQGRMRGGTQGTQGTRGGGNGGGGNDGGSASGQIRATNAANAKRRQAFMKIYDRLTEHYKDHQLLANKRLEKLETQIAKAREAGVQMEAAKRYHQRKAAAAAAGAGVSAGAGAGAGAGGGGGAGRAGKDEGWGERDHVDHRNHGNYMNHRSDYDPWDVGRHNTDHGHRHGDHHGNRHGDQRHGAADDTGRRGGRRDGRGNSDRKGRGGRRKKKRRAESGGSDDGGELSFD